MPAQSLELVDTRPSEIEGLSANLPPLPPIDIDSLDPVERQVYEVKTRLLTEPDFAADFFAHFSQPPEPDQVSEARNRMDNPLDHRVSRHDFTGKEAKKHGVVAAFMTEHDRSTPWGLGNVDGWTSLGGSRVISLADLPGDTLEEKLAAADKRSGDLARDMQRKHPTNFLGMYERFLKGDIPASALVAAMMGGSKSVIVVEDKKAFDALRESDPEARAEIFKEFGGFVDSLKGPVTAVDMGTKATDMNAVRTVTPFVSCQEAEYGGVGDPSDVTAEGVTWATIALLHKMGYTEDQIAKMPIAIQGAGNVGHRLVHRWHELYGDAPIRFSDPSGDAIARLLTDPVLKGADIQATHVDNIDSVANGGVFISCAGPGGLDMDAEQRMFDAGIIAASPAANDPYPTIDGGIPDPKVVRSFRFPVVPAPAGNLGGIERTTAERRVRLGAQNDMADRTVDYDYVKGTYGLISTIYDRAKRDSVTMEEAYDEILHETNAQLNNALRWAGVQI